MPPPATIEPLHVADVTLPEGHPLAGELCAVFAYLIRHADGPVLVDTGVGGRHDGIDRIYRPVRKPLANTLDEAGLHPSVIVAVINTHLHCDHCGENRLFPDTPIYVQAAEYEAAQDPLHTIREWIDFPGVRLEQLSGESELLPGLSVLPTPGHTPGLSVLPTPGHTPGHQSVLVEGEDGLSIIAGQAVYSAAEFAGASPPTEGEWDSEAYARSLASLRGLAPERVYFSHDATVWTKEA